MRKEALSVGDLYQWLLTHCLIRISYISVNDCDFKSI